MNTFTITLRNEGKTFDINIDLMFHSVNTLNEWLWDEFELSAKSISKW